MNDILYTLQFLGISILIIFVIWIPIGIYFKFGIGKKFFHDILKIHIPNRETIDHDYKYEYSICKYCNKNLIKKNKKTLF